jgi:hypothetical protein
VHGVRAAQTKEQCSGIDRRCPLSEVPEALRYLEEEPHLVLQPQFNRCTGIRFQAKPPGSGLTARMAATGLPALGPSPRRPSQPQFPRAVGQRKCHFQQAAHFRDCQLGQEGLRSPFFSVALQLMHNPGHADHRFRRMPSTCSEPCRPLVPMAWRPVFSGDRNRWSPWFGISGRHAPESG